MLTDEQIRNGLINTAYRWPNRIVPFYIDPVFSEYCSTKLQMWYTRRGGKYRCIMVTALDPLLTVGLMEGVMAIVTYPCH